MPACTKRKSELHVQLTNSDRATAHGGQVLVDALCRRFGLWQRVHDEPSLDPRKRAGAGFSPVAHVAQLLFTLTSGGVSLADAERLGCRPVGAQTPGRPAAEAVDSAQRSRPSASNASETRATGEQERAVSHRQTLGGETNIFTPPTCQINPP